MPGQSAIQRVERQVSDEATLDPGAFTLPQILTPGVNLAEFMSDSELGAIGSRVIADVQIDESSRSCGQGSGKTGEGYIDRYRRWLDMAMQVSKPKNFPWPNAANVNLPMLTVAAIQFQAVAYPAIVNGANLVKGRVLGPDPDGEKRARADRMGQHMSWQLLFRMPGWEEDTDRLLLVTPIVGCVFRKTYYDSITNANCSEMVSSEDFIIDYWAKSLDAAPRYTHVLHYYPHEVAEKVNAGLWLPVAAQPEDGSDEEGLIDFYEQHRGIDLDGDGYPEPYVVTTTKDGQVARIVPCFGLDEVTVSTTTGMMRLSDLMEAAEGGIVPKSPIEPQKVVRIERRQYFTKYGFIPAPDGSFYDIGFGALLENISEAANATINQMLNAASLQTAGGGFIGSGVNVRGGNLTFRLGEWKRADMMNALPLRDQIFRMDHPGPSAVLFSLLGTLVQSGKEITSVSEINTGTDQRVLQPTTMLALIQEGQKVQTGILKRIHRSFWRELQVLRRLNRDYLDDEEYFQLNDSEAGVRIGRADYEDRDLDVMPVSDPTAANDLVKVARGQAAMSFNGDPFVNQQAIREIAIESMGLGAEKKRLLTVPEPPPDPKVVLEAMKEARAKEESAAKVRASDAKAAFDAMNAAALAFEKLGLIDDAAKLSAASQALGGTIDDDIGPGILPGLEGEPADAGFPGPAPAAADGLGGDMGPGGALVAGGAGAGGPVGPAGGDQL